MNIFWIYGTLLQLLLVFWTLIFFASLSKMQNPYASIYLPCLIFLFVSF